MVSKLRKKNKLHGGIIMDNFEELLVAPASDVLHKVSVAAMWIFAVVAFFYMALGAFVYTLIFGAAAIALFFAKKYSYVEYEYSNTNGEIEIDSIFEQKNRKRKITFDMKDVLLMAPVESDRYKDNKENVSKVINTVPRGNTDKKYSAIVSKGAVKVEILMVLTQEFIDSCYIYNPRTVVKY